MRTLLMSVGACVAGLLVGPSASAQVVPTRPTISRPFPPMGAAVAVEAPRDLVASALGPRLVRLSWTAPAATGGFVVSRATAPAGPWTTLTATPIASTTFEDATVEPKGAYIYRVAARYGERTDVAAAPVSVSTPCDGYCSTVSCAPKPATLLSIKRGSVGTGAQFRLTLTVTAEDAGTGTALPGTVTANGVTGSVGKQLTFPPCRSGPGTESEIVPCRARITVPGRLATTVLAF